MSIRLEKVNDQIRDLLSQIIHEEFGPQLGMVTIIRVKTTPDLHDAKVYLSVFGRTNNNVVSFLNNQSGKIRKILSTKLHTKILPALTFFYDDSIAQADKIDRILKDQLRD